MNAEGAGARRWIRGGVALVVALALGLSGCVPPSASGLEKPCPEGWTSAVLWSSETAGRSEVAFATSADVVERRTWPFQGLKAAPVASARAGSEAWLVANGDTQRDRTDVLRFSTASCELRSWRVAEQLVLAVAPWSDSFVTTDAFTDAAHLRRRSLGGDIVAETEVPHAMLTTLLVSDDRLFALGALEVDSREQGLLLELDPATLAVRRRVELLEAANTGGGALVKDGEVFYPRAVLTGDREGSALGAVSLSGGAQREVELTSPGPYLIADGGDVIYVGHTFLNSAFREMAEYRFVSRYDLGTGAVETFDVGGPLLSIAVSGESLVVLTGNTDVVTVKTFDAASMKLVTSLEVPRPSGSDYFYPAGLIVR